MLVFDLFAGTGSSTQAFEDAGDTVIKFEFDEAFEADEHIDIMQLEAEELIERYGMPDFVWASPPCTAFSVASIGHHWIDSAKPRTDEARAAMRLVKFTRDLIERLNPRWGFVIENPRGMLRKLPILNNLTRWTVTYCQYGDSRMKPTDLWTNITTWLPRPACANGAPCHDPAPRGARAGTQGRVGAVERSMVPYELGEEIRRAILDLNDGS